MGDPTQGVNGVNEKGEEFVSSVPIDFPIGFEAQDSLVVLMRQVIPSLS